MVFNRGTGKATFYRNGQLVDETAPLTVGTKPPTTGLMIASDCAGPFKGSIDELLIYNRALTGGEVQALYGLFTNGLVGRWDMDEGSGVTATDSSSGGTISGTSPQTVNYGGSGTQVTAAPNTGYHFVQWSDGGNAAARTDTNVTANINVTASFATND